MHLQDETVSRYGATESKGDRRLYIYKARTNISLEPAQANYPMSKDLSAGTPALVTQQ
jgi:hypothetical protein